MGHLVQGDGGLHELGSGGVVPQAERDHEVAAAIAGVGYARNTSWSPGGLQGILNSDPMPKQRASEDMPAIRVERRVARRREELVPNLEIPASAQELHRNSDPITDRETTKHINTEKQRISLYCAREFALGSPASGRLAGAG